MIVYITEMVFTKKKKKVEKCKYLYKKDKIL